MADAKTPEINLAAQAKELLDSGCNLMLSERDITRKVRDYASKNGLSASDAQAYISFLNGSAGAPAWLGQVTGDGTKHSDSRELFAINQLKTTRDGYLTAFTAQAAAHGLNAAAGIAEMRRALTGADPKADETAIGMFNAMGQLGGKPASNYLTDLAFPQHGNAYFNGRDWQEFGARQLEGVWNKGLELWGKAKEAAAPIIGAATNGASAAGAQGESLFGKAGDFFSGLWEKGKDNIGGIAGGLGVGSLFYIISGAIASSVLGGGWISRIIGMAIGAFGAMLGYQTFGKKGDEHTPTQQVSGRGLRHDGPAAEPDLSQLRDRGRSGKNAEIAADIATDKSYCDPADKNCDGKTTALEIYEFDRRMRESAARFAKEKPGAFVPPEPTNSSDIVIPPAQGNSRGAARRQ